MAKFDYAKSEKVLRSAGLGFTFNVIMTSCAKPKRKVKNLIRLLEEGKEVRHAQFDISTIVVDGVGHDLSWLNDPT